MESVKVALHLSSPDSAYETRNKTPVGNVNPDKKSITDVLAEKIKKKGPVLPKRVITDFDKKLYGPALDRPPVGGKKPVTQPK